MLTHVGTNTIETARLILRRFEYSDNEAMRKYYGCGILWAECNGI